MLVVLALGLGSLCPIAQAAEDASLADVVAQLRKQNQLLQEQVAKQNVAIESLNSKVATLESKSTASTDAEKPAATGFGGAMGKVHISGEGAVGFFDTGSEGRFPNSEFRVDEARLFIDAAVVGDVYAFVELNLATSEGLDLNAKLGEAYLDFENVSKLWHRENQLSIRLGRMDVPFGEEYLYRDAIDNPLVSHSVMDFWGVDEGVELYGEFAKVNYIFAVQNGGGATTRDFNSDKSVTLRLGYDATKWLHLGASVMGTGDLTKDDWSELWIGNGVFRPIGSPSTTLFHANLAQGEARIRLPHGHLNFAGGFARYDDNDPTGQHKRDFWFWSAEGVQDLTPKLYVGARFSQIWVDGGYPLPGQGDFMDYYFGDLTTELWRLSLGVGYRMSENLVLKTEYSFERGTTVTGDKRDREDMFSIVAAFKF
ncbi:MAG: hypothetical protein RLY20_1650 [Verrucomicrobiota bacterium]|jgi:hypothetical protein